MFPFVRLRQNTLSRQGGIAWMIGLRLRLRPDKMVRRTTATCHGEVSSLQMGRDEDGSSSERRRVGYAVISLDTPQLAAGSFIIPQ